MAFLLVACLLIEGLRVGLRGKMGDFGPILDAISRLAQGQPLYVGNPHGPTYVYSPGFALMMYPLHVLPKAVVRSLWFFLSWALCLGSWVVASRIIWRDQAGVSVPNGYWALMTVSVWYFVYYNGLNGQSTPLMIFLVILSYYLDLLQRPLLAGVFLAASIMIKAFPIIFLGFFFLRRRFLTLVSAITSTIVFVALPYVYFKGTYLQVLAGWMQVNKQQQTIYDITDWGHQSLAAFWNRVFLRSNPSPFSTDVSDPVNWAIWVTAGVLVLMTARIGFRAGVASWATLLTSHTSFALFMICWAMLPPTSWKHYYITLLFPCALLASFAVVESSNARYARLILFGLAFSQVLLRINLPGADHFFYYMSLCFLMGLAVFVALCFCELKRQSL